MTMTKHRCVNSSRAEKIWHWPAGSVKKSPSARLKWITGALQPGGDNHDLNIHSGPHKHAAKHTHRSKGGCC